MAALVVKYLHGPSDSSVPPDSSYSPPGADPALPIYKDHSSFPVSVIFFDHIAYGLVLLITLEKADPVKAPYSLRVRAYLTPPPYTSQNHTFMARKQRSLSNLFLPPFLHPASSSRPFQTTNSRSRSAAVHTGSPPTVDPFSEALSSYISSDGYVEPHLLDDDPFANLSAIDTRPPLTRASTLPSNTSYSLESALPHTPTKPSPLSTADPNYSLSDPRNSSLSDVSNTQSTSPSELSLQSPNLLRYVSPPLLARPAYTKPAFKPTPSLPSLRVLARGELTPSKKIRKGRVGASLPLEPWNSISSDTGDHPIPNDPSSSWLSDLDIPTGSAFTRSQLFDQGQHFGYDNCFNVPSGHNSPLDMEDQSSHLSFLSHMPSDPSSSYSWDTLSTSDHSHTSSITAYSTESDYQPQFSPSSSIRSRSDSVQIDYRRVLNQFDFDAESFRMSRYSSSGPPASLGSRSRSASPASDSEDYHPSLSVAARSSAADKESEFQPGTSAETIRPRPSRSRLATEEQYFDPTSDQRFSVVSSHDGSYAPCNSIYSDWDEVVKEVEEVEGTCESNTDITPDWMAEAVDGSDGTGRHQDRSGSDGEDSYHSAGDGACTSGRSPAGLGSGSGSGGGRDDDDDQGKNSRRPHEYSVTSAFLETDSENDEDDRATDARQLSQPVPSHPQTGDVSNSDSDDVPLARSIPTALKAQRTIRRAVRNENAQRKQEKVLRLQKSLHSESPRSADILSCSQQADVRPSSSSAAGSRTRALRSKPAPSLIAVDDLTKKLLNLQTTSTTPTVSSVHSSRPLHSSGDFPVGDIQVQDDPRGRSLKPVRSFQQPRMQPDLSVPTSRGRSTTVSRSVASNPSPSGTASTDDKRLYRSKSTRPARAHSATDEMGHRGRSSKEQDTSVRPWVAPPVPPLPSYEAATKVKLETMWQQRIFIGDLQRFSLVEIGASTSAQDVVDILENQGELHGNGWMLFELAQDFGMERPIRSFEMLSSITGSWSADKTVNLFLLKRSQLAPILAISAMPTSSPTYSGYVEYEIKRGKWTKRWMELREHSLWLSKRDSMKGETFLCKLSNFDAYSVTRAHKSPKPFVLAVKSTDNLAFFEDTSDYLHTFSCKEKEGLQWIANILLARSYVLYQERRVVTTKPTTVTRAATTKAATVTRAGTTRRPSQPLVSVSAPATTSLPSKITFEPGSLLGKRGPL